jgi:Tfp pilus assembly protein PilE
LTLIELIVVLVVLVGLAGIIVPMLPNMLTRTHATAGATNLQETTKWVQTFEQLYLHYPSGWDALTNGANYADFIDGTSSSDYTTSNLSATEEGALSSAGITAVYTFAGTPRPTGWSPTFNPYDTGTPTAVNGSGKITFVLLDTPGMVKMGLDTTGKYVVLGLGKKNEMVGKTVAEPPVMFSDDPGSSAADKYQRVGVVFKIGGASGTLDRAFMVGTMYFNPSGVGTLGHELEEYYQSTKSQ